MAWKTKLERLMSPPSPPKPPKAPGEDAQYEIKPINNSTKIKYKRIKKKLGINL